MLQHVVATAARPQLHRIARHLRGIADMAAVSPRSITVTPLAIDRAHCMAFVAR